MEDKRGLNKHGQAAAAPPPMEGQHTSAALQRGAPQKEKLFTPHLSWLTRSPRNSNFWLDTQRHCWMRMKKEIPHPAVGYGGYVIMLAGELASGHAEALNPSPR